jgi:hypothetical protein
MITSLLYKCQASNNLREDTLFWLFSCLFLQTHECLLVVTWYDTTSGLSYQLLQSLRRAEPRRVVASQPALRDAVPPLV